MSAGHHFLARAVLTAYWLGSFALTHWPKLPTPVTPAWLPTDKLVHFALYAGLSGLWLWAAGLVGRGTRTLAPRSANQAGRGTSAPMLGAGRAGNVGKLLGIAGIILMYAVVDELTQPWFGRTCDVRDFAADGLAALVVLGGYAYRQRSSEPGV